MWLSCGVWMTGDVETVVCVCMVKGMATKFWCVNDRRRDEL